MDGSIEWVCGSAHCKNSNKNSDDSLAYLAYCLLKCVGCGTAVHSSRAPFLIYNVCALRGWPPRALHPVGATRRLLAVDAASPCRAPAFCFRDKAPPFPDAALCVAASRRQRTRRVSVMAAWWNVTMARRSAAVLPGGVKVIPCHEAACSRDKRNYVVSILAGWRAVENRCYVKKLRTT